MAIRDLPRDPHNGSLVQINETLDLYTVTNDVCSIIWPNKRVVEAPNFKDLVTELKGRRLGMMVGGFVPGGYQQYDAAQWLPVQDHLGAAKEMGPSFLGFGQSEQDIRYLWGYSKAAIFSACSSRFDAYVAFHEYSQEIERASGNRLFVLARGVFTHYYLQTGFYTCLAHDVFGNDDMPSIYC